MRKYLTIIIVIVVGLLSLDSLILKSYAYEEDNMAVVVISPELGFDGNNANVGLYVSPGGSVPVTAVLRFWRGTTLLRTWTFSGSGNIYASKSIAVTNGYVYKVTADVTINGVVYPTKTVSKYH